MAPRARTRTEVTHASASMAGRVPIAARTLTTVWMRPASTERPALMAWAASIADVHPAKRDCYAIWTMRARRIRVMRTLSVTRVR